MSLPRRKSRMHFIFNIAALTAAALSTIAVGIPLASHAQTFPSKPIRIIVAFPAGGGTDIVARMIAPKLGEALGTQVVIDNRAGAQGIVGTELAAKAPPDGHTLFMGTLGNIA